MSEFSQEANQNVGESKVAEAGELTRYQYIPKPAKLFLIVGTIFAVAIGAYFILGIVVGGLVFVQKGYYYLLYCLLFTPVFLILPARKKDRKRLPWYDLVAAVLTFGICIYFFLHAWSITHGAQDWNPPSPPNFALAFVFSILTLESARRGAGPIYAAVCLIAGVFPLVANCMPGLLYGRSFSLANTIASYVFGGEGFVGLVGMIQGEILIGFLTFAAVMVASGAGQFFYELALSIFGKTRGGPAKVAVVASGLFGSLSGDALANVSSTGVFTIPAMKRAGYSPVYAGAIEACASSGGMFMPPVMGATAFVMCGLIGVEYGVVITAAAIPAILYYYGLLMQVDAYAARVGLKGLPPEEIPSFKGTLKKGWMFIFVLFFLIWGLLYMRWGMMTPFYASGLMFVLSFLSRETMMTPRRTIETIVEVGKLLVRVGAIILPLGIIFSALNITGSSGSATTGLVILSAGNLWIVLLVGVIMCYILGMMGLITAAYIFLAISLAPAVLQITDINVLAIHLFIIYYAVLSNITLPVAVVAFVGATIAGASPVATAWRAMRLGIVIYIIPFFFLFNPALIFQGTILETLYLFVLCVLGIGIIAAGVEGYLLKFGTVSLWERPLLVIAGTLIAFPNWSTTFIGATLALLTIAIMLMRRRTQRRNQELVR